MLGDLQNPRRTPRVPARLRAEVRHGLRAWRAEVEDVGAGGCQLVTPQPIRPGQAVRLALVAPALDGALRVAGRVRWASAREPCRIGVAFRKRAPWLVEKLAAIDLACAAASARFRADLPRDAALHLGTPPRLAIELTADERAVLARVGGGATADAVVRSFGEGADRAVGALFALLARGFLTLAPVPGGGPAAWRAALAGPGTAEPGRPPGAERLHAEGLALLAAGKMELAVARFEEALTLAPSDAALEAQLARLSPWV